MFQPSGLSTIISSQCLIDFKVLMYCNNRYFYFIILWSEFMTFNTSPCSSSFDASRQKYETVFSGINDKSLKNLDSVIKKVHASNIEELVQFVHKGILCTDPDIWKETLPRLMNMAEVERREDLFNRIGAICEERGVRVYIPQQHGASSSSSGVGYATLQEKISGQIETITPTIFRIKCLDQRALQGGDVTCGYHALKNALVAMAIGEDFVINSHLFEDKALYDDLEANVCLVKGKGLLNGDDDDVSVAPLTVAWDRIVKNQIPVFSTIDTPLNWNSKGLSMFDSINGDRLVITDSLSINYAANLKEFSQNRGPCQHVFLVGGNGHWVTVICEKDDQQKLRWYGVDSMTDSTSHEHILDAINLLDKALMNVNGFAVRQYYQNVWEFLERKINLNFTNNPIVSQDVDVVKNAAHFMEQMGWLDRPQECVIERFINQMKPFVAYYTDNGIVDTLFVRILNRERRQLNPLDLEITLLELKLLPTTGLESAFADFKKMPNKMKRTVLKAIYIIRNLSVHGDAREEMINFIELAKILPINVIQKLSKRLKLISTWRVDERFKVSSQNLKSILEILKEGKIPIKIIEKMMIGCDGNSDMMLDYVKLFQLLPQNISIELDLILDYSENWDAVQSAAKYLLLRYPSVREQFLKSLQIDLDIIADPVKARNLAKAIFDNTLALASLLGTHDPLFTDLLQKAQKVIDKTTEQALSTQDNPYAVVKLHEIYQQAQNPEKRIFQNNGEPLVYDIGVMDTWNVSTFTRGDISQGISSDTFSELFRGMEERLGNDPIFEQYILEEQYEPTIDPEFKQGEPPTFEKLKNNLLVDSYIQRLLKLPEGDSESIEPAQYQQYCIIESLLKADSTVAPGELVSPREQMLLQYSRYIIFCDTGKKEGIGNAYRLIPGTRSVRLTIAAEKFIEDFTYQFFQDKMRKIIDGEEFMKALLKKSSINQRNHQSDFIKRRFGKLVGLKEDIKLDMWTNNLCPEIHDITPEQFIKTFYQFFDIPGVMQEYTAALKEKLTNEIKLPPEIRVLGIYDHLQRTYQVSDQEAFEMDEDLINFIGITPKLTEVIRDSLMLLKKPDPREMSPMEIVELIKATGCSIDLSECTHLNQAGKDLILAHTQKLTINEIRQQYPDLQIIDAAFWSELGIEVDEIPPFQNSAAEMKAILDRLHTKGVVEEDAGATLMLMPKGLTVEKLQALDVPSKPMSGDVQKEFGSKQNKKNYWVVISNGLLVGSRDRGVETHRAWVKREGGTMPNLLEGYALPIVTSLLETKKGVELKDRKRVFSRDASSAGCTRLSDRFQCSHLYAGFFSRFGLAVSSCNENYDVLGVALALRL